MQSKVSILPELVYAWMVRLFLFGIVVSGILTFGFVKPDMTVDPIIAVYGALNVCITFDYSPAKEVMTVIWVFICALFNVHVITFNFRLTCVYGPSSCMARMGKAIGTLVVILVSSMVLCFLFPPSETIMGHTLPYQALLVGLMIWWIFNAIVIETWPNVAVTAIRLWRIFTLVFLTVSVIKLYLQWVLMLRYAGVQEAHEHFVPAGKVRQIPDMIWMLLFVFYRCWHPLSGSEVIVTFAPDEQTESGGGASIWCYHADYHVVVDAEDQPKVRKGGYKLSPEKLFSWSVGLLMLGIVVSGIMTFGFVKPDMSVDPVIAVYGAINVCITFDYAPARQMMAVLWMFICSLFFLHVIIFNFRLSVVFGPKAALSRVGRALGVLVSVLFAASILLFLMHPSESVVGHTVPYQAQLVALMIWWIFNAVVIENWPNESASVIRYWRVLTLLFVTVTLIKLYLQWVLMLRFHGVLSPNEHYAPAGPLRQVPDMIWMVLFMFYPCWHPLSDSCVIISLAPGSGMQGTTEVCCFELDAKVDEHEMRTLVANSEDPEGPDSRRTRGLHTITRLKDHGRDEDTLGGLFGNGRCYSQELANKPGGIKLDELILCVKLAILAYADDTPGTMEGYEQTEAGREIISAIEGVTGSQQAARQPLTQILKSLGFTLDKLFSHTKVTGSLDAVDTQGYIAHNDTDVVLAYRGTTNLKDWFSNLSTLKTEFEPLSDQASGHSGACSILEGHCGIGFGKPRCHKGFYNAFLVTIPDLEEALLPLLSGSPKRILIVGHSLGGALATAALGYLLQKHDFVKKPHRLLKITAGAPRFGDTRFGEWLTEQLALHQENPNGCIARLINDRDIVPTVPPKSLGFNHHRKTCLMTDDGELLIGPNVLLSHFNFSVTDHMPRRYLDGLLQIMKGGS